VGAPGPDLRDCGLVDSLDADVSGLPGIGRVRPADDLPLARFVDESVADPELHREDPSRGGRHPLLTHVLPTLGSMRLRDLHRRHVKTLPGAKRAERLSRTVGAQSSEAAPVKVGYSKNTVRLIKAALSTVLSDAVDDGYLETNPAFGAGRKRGKRAEALTQAERLQKIRPMSWHDRDAFLAASARRHRYHALFAVLAKAGLRPGEAFALQPGDLDLKARTLRVERAVTIGARVKDTKTHDVRTVDLTQDLAQIIRRWIVSLKAESLAAGRGEPAWLFPKADGTLMDKDHAAAVFRKILTLAKLSGYRVYDCRHTYASLLLASGAPITYVAQQLGHSSPATTLRFYARWIPSKGRRWADVLDRSTKATAGMPAELEPESGTIAEAVQANA